MLLFRTVFVGASDHEGVEAARHLFNEYAEGLGIDLSFQNFGEELARLPGEYVAPSGCLLLGYQGVELAGCAALRALDRDTGEMKRLYVRPGARGSGAGRALAAAVIHEARHIGYRRLRLDTMPSTAGAIALYRSLGFCEIAAYRRNPVPGALFFELVLE